MKRRTWLIVAVLLIAAATALMLYAEEPQPSREELSVNFPSQYDSKFTQRMRDRRTLAVLPAPEQKEDQPARPSRPRDPVLAAIASGSKSAVVVEANALRNSPIGELLLECLMARGRKNPITELKERTGVDLLQDLDRVAMTDHGVVMSGHFENARWKEFLGERSTASSYGEQATMYALPGRPEGRSAGMLVSWGGEMVMFAEDEAQARAAVDRLEGRAESTPVLDEEQTYGDIYGVLSMEDVTRMFGKEQPEMAARFTEVAQRVELHVDASRDVGIVANVQGEDASAMEDLGKSMGGLLAGARLKSMAEGEEELAELLDLARVRPRANGTFGLEVGLPLELLQKQLAFCKDENYQRTGRRESAAGAADATPAPVEAVVQE